MLTAYLVANQSLDKAWLDGMVILLDPNYNPDGRDRHTEWANGISPLYRILWIKA